MGQVKINSEGAGQVQVYRAAVQEKEQRQGWEQHPVHVDGKQCVKQGCGSSAGQEDSGTQRGSL